MDPEEERGRGRFASPFLVVAGAAILALDGYPLALAILRFPSELPLTASLLVLGAVVLVLGGTRIVFPSGLR
jgi:hypothetical protein